MDGQCLCGRIRIYMPDHREIEVCHCTMCRGWGGGPAFVIGCEANDLTIEGREHISEYASSDWAHRAFCRHCGTHLYYRLNDGGLHTLGAGLFSQATHLKVTKQIFIDEKPGYYDLANDTPVMTGPEVFADYTQDQS